MTEPNLPAVQMVDVTIGGRTYRLAAPTGQETRLRAIAARVDALVEDIRSTSPGVERDRHLVLTCLQLCASLADAHQKLDDQAAAVTLFHRSLAERLEALNR